MSHRKGSLGGPNIHQAEGAGKPSRSGKPTISDLKRNLAASYRAAGFSGRQAALMVDTIVRTVRAKLGAAA